jgi:hypothetical protein
MIVETNKRGEFKKNITIKCGQNARNNLNTNTMIIKISQLGVGMPDKGHCLEIVNNTQHKWSSHMENQQKQKENNSFAKKILMGKERL